MYTFLELVDFFNEHGFIINLVFYKSYIECNICHESWVTNDLAQARELPDFSGKDITEVEFRMRKYIELTGMTKKKQ